MNKNILILSIKIETITNSKEKPTIVITISIIELSIRLENKLVIIFLLIKSLSFIKYIEKVDGAANLIIFINKLLSLILENKITYKIAIPNIVGEVYDIKISLVILIPNLDISNPYILYKYVITYKSIILIII